MTPYLYNVSITDMPLKTKSNLEILWEIVEILLWDVAIIYDPGFQAKNGD